MGRGQITVLSGELGVPLAEHKVSVQSGGPGGEGAGGALDQANPAGLRSHRLPRSSCRNQTPGPWPCSSYSRRGPGQKVSLTDTLATVCGVTVAGAVIWAI